MTEQSTDATECVTCGGPNVAMLPETRDRDECRACEREQPKTRTAMVVYRCSECGAGYRGPKFAETCCIGEQSDTETQQEADR
jgi:ribosomal protein L37AE/L43A